MVDIDVLIVTYRGGALLERCLTSLATQTQRPRRTVVVVSSNVAVSVPDHIEVLRTERPSHFAPAANLGLKTMGTCPVVLLNDDTWTQSDFIERIARAIIGPGIYQPRIQLPDGRVDNTGHLLYWDGFNVARGRGSNIVDLPERTGAFSGAAVCFTPEVLERVGLFDPDFGAYGEDLDLSLRAVRQGFPIRYVRDAVVTHALGATYGRVSPAKIYRVEKNRTQAAIRSLPAPALIAMPATAALRWAVMAIAAARGEGLGDAAGVRGALAAVAGALAGTTAAPMAWTKRKQDKPRWSGGDREMWRHLCAQCVPLHQLAGRSLTAP